MPPQALVIAPESPFPPLSGAQTRTYHVVRTLTERFDVTVLTYAREKRLAPCHSRVREIAIPWEPPPLYEQMRSPDRATAASAYAQLAAEDGDPWIATYYDTPAMRSAVLELEAAGPDLVIVEQSLVGRLAEAFGPEVPKVLDLHNVHALTASRAAERSAPDAHVEVGEARRVLAWEQAVASSCDVCMVVSEREAAAARDLLGVRKPEVIPNGVDVDFFVPSFRAPRRGELLFTGQMSYAPNIEAMEWFARDVHRLLPGTTLRVVGAQPDARVLALADDDFVVEGQVSDTRPYQWDAHVVVVPLLSGGGTRLKVLEAAACGKAIVTTSFGAEGIALESGRDVLMADTAVDFAAAVAHALEDDALRGRLGERARAVAERYAWTRLGERILAVVDELLEAVPAR